MLTHDQIWAAIDQMAERNGKSVSGLARAAGLDPTSFNPSKRMSKDGRPRWPSTESIAHILRATGESFDAFSRALPGSEASRVSQAVPLVGLAQAGSGGFFGDNGLPQGEGWDSVPFPSSQNDVFAIEVQGDSMLPLYRDGDILIVDPAAQLRRGDRVVAKTREGEVLAKILDKHTQKIIVLASLNPDHEARTFEPSALSWIARVVWASQ